MKIGYIGLIKSDFVQQARGLVQISTVDIQQLVSPPASDHLQSWLPLICWFFHNRYGITITGLTGVLEPSRSI
jgi:hypothetical protein